MSNAVLENDIKHSEELADLQSNWNKLDSNKHQVNKAFNMIKQYFLN